MFNQVKKKSNPSTIRRMQGCNLHVAQEDSELKMPNTCGSEKQTCSRRVNLLKRPV